MKIVTEPQAAVEATNEDDAVKVATQGVVEAMKESESGSEGSGRAKAGKAETSGGRPQEPAKTRDASNALQAVRVFEDAEYHGAKFESLWNRLFSCYCAYDENTTIPAMRYTHGRDCDVCTTDTLQVFSVKVASIKKGLRWPLQVYGMISARDVVDRKRNIIFHRERDNCQTITKQDRYLTLTGPSRAVVVSTDPSYIEVVLKVKGSTNKSSKDKELSRVVARYRAGSCVSGLYPSERSTLELRFGLVANSIEATVHVRVTGGSWPDGFKGVFSAGEEGVNVKLLDVSGDGLPVDAADGMIRLSRRVVSVQKGRMLKVFVSACSTAGNEERREASFVSAEAGVSSGVELKIGSCRMEATVAWSLFNDDY
ncbi:hypothetical protein ACQ4PT_004875 [Festuca glaucescens]